MMKKNKLIAFETLPEQLSKREWDITKTNPRYWKLDGVRQNFTHVYAPSYPEIEQAYTLAGKEIVSFGSDVVTPVDWRDVVAIERLYVVDDEPERVSWRDMKWADLRQFVFKHSPDAPKNLKKNEAFEILEQLEREGKI